MTNIFDWSIGLPTILAALGFGYLLGSIPFGLIITKFAGLGDVRSIGSGNIGATNVLRTGNKGLAAATLIADILKGLFAVLVCSRWSIDLAILAGLGAFLGHCFPIWLKFNGGKGVATYVGVLAGFSWKIVILFAVAWLLIVAITRYSSLGALVASVAATAALFFQGQFQTGTLFVILTALVWIFHRSNISSLISGDERKVGQKG